MTESPLPRPTVRVLLFDEAGRLLLLRHAADSQPERWGAPGGGIRNGESPEQAAERELWEEVGILAPQLSPCVWLRSIVYPTSDGLREMQERYYVCRVISPDIVVHNRTDWERDVILDQRWWTCDEIEASTDQLFVPRSLGRLLRPILAGVYPTEPLTVEI